MKYYVKIFILGILTFFAFEDHALAAWRPIQEVYKDQDKVFSTGQEKVEKAAGDAIKAQKAVILDAQKTILPRDEREADPTEVKEVIARLKESSDMSLKELEAKTEVILAEVKKESEKILQERDQETKAIYESKSKQFMYSMTANFIAIIGILIKIPSRSERKLTKLLALEKEAELISKGVIKKK